MTRFHLVDPATLNSIDDFAAWLEAILHNPCSVQLKDDRSFVLIETKQLVARLSGLRIEIYPKDHAPPHFHVKSPDVNASFRIDDCGKIAGNLKDGDYRKVRYWHSHSKPLLIESWNKMRPTDCTVGRYTAT